MTDPEIQHIGHAGIMLKYNGMTLTMDPWFNPAFLRSWFPYPDNREFEFAARNDSEYIYISHAHEDHFDRQFLYEIDPTFTTVIVPKFRSRSLDRELIRMGFTFKEGSLVVLGHGESMTLLNGLKVTMLIDRSHKEDSALLVETPEGYRFLNSNDCELAIPDWPKDIDLLACQFSGAFWYPHCYDFNSGEMLAKAAEVRQNNLERLYRRVRLTEADTYLPSAGPPVFLDINLQQYNHSPIFPLWEELDEQFEYEFPNVRIHRYLNRYQNISDYSKARYSEWAAWYFHNQDLTVTPEEVYQHFRQLQRVNQRLVGDWGKDVELSSGKAMWQVRLGLVEGELEESFDPTYWLNVQPRVLREIIDGHATWETALLSHRVKLRRDPDQYDETLMGLLAFGDRPAQTVTMVNQRNLSERVIKGGFEFQRWCPHAGEDLTYATVENRTITCPRHEWTWNADTGQCIKGGSIPLQTCPVPDWAKEDDG